VVHTTPPCLKKEVLLLGRAGRTTIMEEEGFGKIYDKT
jgi:hypothetical protein